MRPTPRLLLATTALAFVAVTTPRAQQAPARPAPRPFNGITTGVPHAPFPALPNRDALEIQ